MTGTAALHQKIIDLRSELIMKRIEIDRQIQTLELLERRNQNLETALKAIMERSKKSEAYTNEAFIYNIAHNAIHSD